MLTRRDLFQNTLKAISAIAGWEVGKRLFGSRAKADKCRSGTECVGELPDGCAIVDIVTHNYTVDGQDAWLVGYSDMNGNPHSLYLYHSDGRIERIHSFGEQK